MNVALPPPGSLTTKLSIDRPSSPAMMHASNTRRALGTPTNATTPPHPPPTRPLLTLHRLGHRLRHLSNAGPDPPSAKRFRRLLSPCLERRRHAVSPLTPDLRVASR